MAPVAGQAGLLLQCVDDTVHFSRVLQCDDAFVEAVGGTSVGALRVDGFDRMRRRGCFGHAAASGERRAEGEGDGGEGGADGVSHYSFL